VAKEERRSLVEDAVASGFDQHRVRRALSHRDTLPNVR